MRMYKQHQPNINESYNRSLDFRYSLRLEHKKWFDGVFLSGLGRDEMGLHLYVCVCVFEVCEV